MKRILIAAASIGLLSAAPAALAAPAGQGHGGQGHGQHAGPGGQGPGQHPGPGGQGYSQHRPWTGGQRFGYPGVLPPGGGRQPGSHWSDNRGRQWQWDGRNNRPEGFNRSWYHANRFADRRFHLGPYRAPLGWTYRRWRYGQFLPFIFLAQEFWLTQYWQYNLPVPPVGCEWVRYGDDALLVDTATGEILQVLYGQFD